MADPVTARWCRWQRAILSGQKSPLAAGARQRPGRSGPKMQRQWLALLAGAAGLVDKIKPRLSQERYSASQNAHVFLEGRLIGRLFLHR